MPVIGLDIGTTTLKCVLMDDSTNTLLDSIQSPNSFELSPGVQDAKAIAAHCEAMVAKIQESHAPVKAIGLTGQMHGILYVDSSGLAQSPLYTWQFKGDEQAALAIESKTGHPIHPGYGCATYYQHLLENRVSKNAAGLCTIADYVGMALCRRARPLLHTTQAASLGLFDLAAQAFDTTAIDTLSLDPRFFPEVCSSPRVLGETAAHIPVYTALGDHQASFLGAAGTAEGSLAVNIGTGSQVSILIPHFLPPPAPLELRPFLNDTYLLTGAALCGGQAYAVLEQFLRSCAALFGIAPKDIYPLMNEAALNVPAFADPLHVCADFLGTRQEPLKKGSISQIGPDNLTAPHLIAAFLQGMTDTLFTLYESAIPLLPHKPEKLIGSGNAIRQNPALRRALESRFGLPLTLPLCKEEAAWGAARFALLA